LLNNTVLNISNVKRIRRKCTIRKNSSGARKSSEYKNWRTAVFTRDKYRCRNCGRGNIRIQAHHILGFEKYPQYRYKIDNGLTLCGKCHYIFHKKYGKSNFPNITKVWNIMEMENI